MAAPEQPEPSEASEELEKGARDGGVPTRWLRMQSDGSSGHVARRDFGSTFRRDWRVASRRPVGVQVSGVRVCSRIGIASVPCACRGWEYAMLCRESLPSVRVCEGLAVYVIGACLARRATTVARQHHAGRARSSVLGTLVGAVSMSRTL